MSKSCLNLNNPVVSELLKSAENSFPGYKENQIVNLASLYFDKYNKIPDVQQLVDFKANLDITSTEKKFEEESVPTLEDNLDILQALFFNILNKAAKGRSLTKTFINKAQGPVLQSVKKFLEANQINDILNNYAVYQDYLINSRLKNLNIDLDIDLEKLENQDSKDELWSSDSTFKDNVQRASDEVIYLFAGLTSDEKIRGLNRPYHFNEAWNRTQNLLAGTSDLPTQIQLIRLSDLPFKEQLLEKLGYGNYDELSEADYGTIRTSFMSSFAVVGNNLSKSSSLGKQSTDAIEDTLSLNIKSNWRSNFLNSDLTKIINGKRILNPDKYELFENSNSEEFLKLFGIELTEWDDSLNNDARLIKNKFFTNELKQGKSYSWLDESNEITTALNNLVKHEMQFQKKVKPLGARNANNEYQHSIGLHSYLTKTIGQLKYGLILAKKGIFDFQNLFIKGQAEPNIAQGARGKGEGKTFANLNRSELYTSIIGDMFSSQPIIHLPRTADKTSEEGFKIPVTKELLKGKDKKEYLNEILAYTYISDKLYKRLYTQYQADYNKKTLKSVGWSAKGTNGNIEPKQFWHDLLKYDALNPITESDFKTKINNYIVSQEEDLYNNMVKHGVINKNKDKLYTTFSMEFISPNYKNLSLVNQKIEINKVLTNWIFNSLMFGTESTQMNMGSLTVLGFEEFFKRTAGPIAKGKQRRMDAAMINQLIAERPEYMSKFPSPAVMKVMISAEDIKDSFNAKQYNELGDTDKYNEVNVDDAQGKMLFEIYKEFKQTLNEWTPSMDAGYQLLLQDKLDQKEFESLYPPMKPVSYSLIDVNGVQVPIYIKTSIYPIHKNWVKGTLNENLYEGMLKEGISLHLPKSGIKVSYPDNLKNQFDKNGEFIFNNNATFEIKGEDFRSQLDVNVKDKFKLLQGTQQQKLIAQNLYNNGVITDEEFTNWTKEREETLQEISNIEFNKLKDKAGIIMEDELPSIKNYSKLKSMLKDELKNRELPINTVEAINEIIDEDGFLLSTIDALPSRQKLMNVLNSIVNNKLIKLYTNGASLVQVAQTGWELKPGSTVESETSIDFINNEAKTNYIKNNGLQFLKIDKKTGAAEILLPAKYKKFVNLDGTIDERCLINIGYRIPTQGLNSILHLKVVGFLPLGMDQMVIMPREITTQGGSDFDVDKLNLFVPNVTFDKRYISQDMNPEEEFNKFLTAIEDKKIEAESNKLNKQVKSNTEIFKNLIYDNAPGYTQEELDEISIDNKIDKSKWIQEFKLKQLQNLIIEQDLKILEHENSRNSLLSPNSADKLSKLAKDYSENKNLKMIDAFKPQTVIDITEQMFASKALVGVFASQITHHVLSQQVGLIIDEYRPFYFNRNTVNINGQIYTSLSGVKDVNGELITDIIGNQLVSGAVDAAKDPFLFNLGINMNTGSTFAFFKRTGADLSLLVELVKQPIVQDYLLETANNKQLGLQFTTSKSNIIKDLLKNYGGYHETKSEYLVEKYSKLEKDKKANILNILKSERDSFGNWEKHLSKLKAGRGIGKLSTEEFNELQKIVLDDFLYLQDAAQILGESVQTSKFDTSGPGKDIVQSFILNNNYENFKAQMFEKGFKKQGKSYQLATIKDNQLANYDRLITNTLLNVFYKNSSKLVLNLYRDLVLLKPNSMLSTVLENFNDPNGTLVNKKLDEDSATLIYGSMINYIIQRGLEFDSNLFFGKDSVAQQIKNIQANLNHPLYDNYLINNVFNIELSSEKNIPDIIGMQNKNIDSREANYITQQFGKIKETDEKLYNSLIMINFFQTGVVTSPVSFYSLLPYQDVLNVANKILNKHQNIINSQYDLTKMIMSNVGTKLNNVKRVNFKKDDVFGNFMVLTPDRTENKDYIYYIYKNTTTKVTESAIFEKVEGGYKMLDPKNYKTLFYNFLDNDMTFKREEETNDNQKPENEEIPSDNKSPFKEEFVPENVGVENNSIYNQLGYRTKSENVVIKPWAELKDATKAITPEGIVSTRIKNSNEHFGNPFSHDPAGKAQGLIKTKTVQEAVEKYIEWLTTDKYDFDHPLKAMEDTEFNRFHQQIMKMSGSTNKTTQEQFALNLLLDLLNRKKWINDQLKSGTLINKPILYYKELLEPSHATALDYLINKYDWKNVGVEKVNNSNARIGEIEKNKDGSFNIRLFEGNSSDWRDNVLNIKAYSNGKFQFNGMGMRELLKENLEQRFGKDIMTQISNLFNNAPTTMWDSLEDWQKEKLKLVVTPEYFNSFDTKKQEKYIDCYAKIK
jgi:hypothetical protein